jgi:cold shock CspA family protein
VSRSIIIVLIYFLVTPLVEATAMSLKGTCKTFGNTSGFGFIIAEEGPDVFVHITDCKDGMMPVKGDVLYYDLGPSTKKPGQTAALNVTGGSAKQTAEERKNGGKDMTFMMHMRMQKLEERIVEAMSDKEALKTKVEELMGQAEATKASQFAFESQKKAASEKAKQEAEKTRRLEEMLVMLQQNFLEKLKLFDTEQEQMCDRIKILEKTTRPPDEKVKLLEHAMKKFDTDFEVLKKETFEKAAKLNKMVSDLKDKNAVMEESLKEALCDLGVLKADYKTTAENTANRFKDMYNDVEIDNMLVETTRPLIERVNLLEYNTKEYGKAFEVHVKLVDKFVRNWLYDPEVQEAVYEHHDFMVETSAASKQVAIAIKMTESKKSGTKELVQQVEQKLNKASKALQYSKVILS